MSVPVATPADLAERYRLLRPFDEAETTLVRRLIDQPNRLDRRHEETIRLALNAARLWVVPGTDGPEIVIGPKLGHLRDKVRTLADTIRDSGDTDPASLARDAEALRPLLEQAKEKVLSSHSGHVLASAFDREVGEKRLVLVLGGGGGCGFVHLGMFSVLEKAGLVPSMVVGSSIGSILGLFRSREARYRDSTVRAVTQGLTFKKLFRVLEGEPRYGLPGTLRLYLRGALSRFFVGDHGETMRLNDLDVPFMCVVTGVQRLAVQHDIEAYEKAFAKELRRGAFGALLHLKDLAGSWVSVMTDLIKSGGLRPIALGGDDLTGEFDVLDAVGFSCSVPALIHYDILRDDPRMHSLMQETLKAEGVQHFIDGGISANVPARLAWESVQRGRIGSRNSFILGFDCFAPQLGRNMIFAPLMRLAAENVATDRAFAHHMFTYRKVLSPAALVPGRKAMAVAIKNGKAEFGKEIDFVRKMVEPLPAI